MANTVKVNNNRSNPFTVRYSGGVEGKLNLQPGENENIKEDEWRAAIQHPLVERRMTDGSLDGPSEKDLKKTNSKRSSKSSASSNESSSSETEQQTL